MKREIPLKNYIILLLIVVASVLLVLNLANTYKENKKKEALILQELLSEIKKEEIESYLLENPDAIIYLMKEHNEDDKKIKKYIVNNDLKNKIVILNCMEETIDLSKYNNKKQIATPNFIIFEDGKIKKIMYKNENKITYQIFKNFIEANGVLDD